MTTMPIEARCDHCQQMRPLFRYQPDHNAHAIPVPCTWCDREQQPLLCTRCWSKGRKDEEERPMSAEEQAATAFLYGLLRDNARLAARADADRATCEAIAHATDQALGGPR